MCLWSAVIEVGSRATGWADEGKSRIAWAYTQGEVKNSARFYDLTQTLRNAWIRHKNTAGGKEDIGIMATSLSLLYWDRINSKISPFVFSFSSLKSPEHAISYKMISNKHRILYKIILLTSFVIFL